MLVRSKVMEEFVMSERTSEPATTTWKSNKDTMTLQIKVGSWANPELIFPRAEVEKAYLEMGKFLRGGGS
jgi:hypothetical protein